MDQDPQLPSKQPSDWKKFRRLKFDSKAISRRARKAETKTARHAHRFILKRMDSLRESRRAILLWIGAVGMIVLATAVQAVMYGANVTTEAAAPDGTYAEGVVGKLDTLNPLYASSAPEIAASRLVFSSLYDYDKTGALHPDVAQKMVVDESGKNYTVTLRDTVKWHDGARLTADDVVFTIQTIKNPAARVRSSLQVNWRDIAVKKIDDKTVQFTLPAYAAFPHALTFPIVPKHLLEGVSPSTLYESSFSRSPVGSGPFMYRLLQSPNAISDQKVFHMTANPDYYNGKPRLGRYELHAYTDENSLIKAVNAFEVTGAADISSARIKDIKNPAYVSRQYSINNGVYALMNNATGLFSDSKVRQAVQAAVDTAKVRQVAGEDVAPLDLPFLRSQISDSSAIGLPSVDPARARTLLDEAGWKVESGSQVRKKDAMPLKLRITTTKNTQYEQVAETISQQLKAVGFDASVEVIDDKAPNANFIVGTLQGRNFDMLVYELPIGADPDVYAYWHSSQAGLSGYNFANYKNSVADVALASARDRLDFRLREAKYISFAKEWLKDAPALGLYQQSVTYIVNKNASVMDDNTIFVLTSDRYASVHHWTVNRSRVYTTP